MLSPRELCADVITPRVVPCSPPVESLPSPSLHAPAHLVSSLPTTALPPPYRCGHAIRQISVVMGCGTPPPASENSVAAEIQARLQRPRLPRLCCEKARFRWQVFRGHLSDQIARCCVVAGGYIGELGGEKCSCSASRNSDHFGGRIKQNSPSGFAIYRSDSVEK